MENGFFPLGGAQKGITLGEKGREGEPAVIGIENPTEVSSFRPSLIGLFSREIFMELGLLQGKKSVP